MATAAGVKGAAVEPRRAEDLPRARRVAAFVFILIAEFFYGWAWNTVDVLRPYIRDDLRLTLGEAGATYSAQSAGALVGAVVMAQLADRYGRRNMLAVVTGGYAASLLAGVWVGGFASLMLQRAVLGFFLGGIFPIVVGIYVSLFHADIRGRLASLVQATYNGSIVALGYAGSLLFDVDWKLLLWIGAVPPLAIAFLMLVIMPDDRRLVPWGGYEHDAAASAGKLPIAQLFLPGVRRRTLLLAALTGINFFAYQAFNGWVTTYLKDVRGLSGEAIGTLVAWQFGGAILGCFVWGWLADRYGRKLNALGFFAAAALIIAYLRAPQDVTLLAATGFAYGFCLSSSMIWGPWIAEMYPAHLRSTAASIFNWGRVISFFAPPITAAVADAFGLTVGMGLASASFLLAACIWLLLPETLRRPAAA